MINLDRIHTDGSIELHGGASLNIIIIMNILFFHSKYFQFQFALIKRSVDSIDADWPNIVTWNVLLIGHHVLCMCRALCVSYYFVPFIGLYCLYHIWLLVMQWMTLTYCSIFSFLHHQDQELWKSLVIFFFTFSLRFPYVFVRV